MNRCQYNTNIYFDDGAIVLLYVDDILIFKTVNNNKVVEIKEGLGTSYKIKRLGKVRKFLGYEIKYTSNGVS